jgi:hypothetical protein
VVASGAPMHPNLRPILDRGPPPARFKVHMLRLWRDIVTSSSDLLRFNFPRISPKRSTYLSWAGGRIFPPEYPLSIFYFIEVRVEAIRTKAICCGVEDWWSYHVWASR